MSQSVRQSNLFAAEDWRTIYRAFLNVNFTSYDFDTIRTALVEYIRLNYPEDFNDFIDSSEFIAIIDILSWLGENLAFRVDLNARENFFDTAERRESILRLAKLISYNAKRNTAAQGFLKIVGVQTDADITDSNGSNLNGINIQWNDPNNPDWYEQFILILNSAFITSNRFGQPIQSGRDVTGNRVQVYRLNNFTPTNPGVYGFNANVDGASLNFEAVNISWTDEDGYKEREPVPGGPFHIAYRNDGEGNESANTGFFTYFKQGSLQNRDFNVSIPEENRVLDVNVNNINETDVWVQNIDQFSQVERRWTKVPSAVTSNIIYNNIDRPNRDIFSVETRENDQISIRFGDGRFGNVAFGLTRIYFRTSFGDRTTIRPRDIQNIKVTIPYTTANNLTKNLTITLALQESITNGAPAETDEDIRLNAPQLFYTQNRMVSGEDYNIFPLSESSILKAKAINRTYAGHNRYIDINDPTGTYQNTNVFAEDGILYREEDYNLAEVAEDQPLTAEEIITTVIQPFLNEQEFKNFLVDAYRNAAKSSLRYESIFLEDPSFGRVTNKIMWDRISGSKLSSTGRFVRLDTIRPIENQIPIDPSENPIPVGVQFPAANPLDILKEGSIILFENAGWTTVNAVTNFGLGTANNVNGVSGNKGLTDSGEGAIRLNKSVLEGDRIKEIFPRIRTTLNNTELEAIRLKLQSNATFGIYYEISTDSWRVIDPPTGGFDPSSPFTYETGAPERNWMIWLENNAISTDGNDLTWLIRARGLRYVFESEQDVRFFYVNDYKVVNQETGLTANDFVEVFETNESADIYYRRRLQNRTMPTFQEISNNPQEYPAGTVFQNEQIGGSYILNQQSNTPNESFGTYLDNGRVQALPQSLGRNLKINLIDNFRYGDGYIEPRRVLVSFTDEDTNGAIDDPTVFDEIIFGDTSPSSTFDPFRLIFWERYTSYDDYSYFRPIKNVQVFSENSMTSAESALETSWNSPDTASTWVDGDVAYLYSSTSAEEKFVKFDSDLTVEVLGVQRYTLASQGTENRSKYKYATGRDKIRFNWRHFAPTEHRIDPSKSNIIDIFALTSEYDFLIRQYIEDPENNVLPEPPSSTQMALSYNNLNDLKMISDEIVWHPVKYRLLFGAKAPEELRAKIKIIKLPNTTLSDGEIKARTIQLTNEYFGVNNWDFGDTFYFSELAAFIHQGLALSVASVVLVPLNEESSFGTLYEVKAQPDEIFISSATVDDVEIIQVNTPNALRINR